GSSRASDTSRGRAPSGAGNAPEHLVGGGEVLRRHAERLVDRDVAVGQAAAQRAVVDVADLAEDMVLRDRAGLQRVDIFAGLRLRAGERVDEIAPPRQARVVDLAGGGDAGADEIDVLAGLQPFAVED